VQKEFAALTETAGWLDLSARSRLCLLGEDAASFLHGQVTNDITGLAPFTGCYATLVDTKGKMQSDLLAYRLAEEILIDFEPGYAGAVQSRLEKFIITEDVEIADAAPHFAHFTVQGPEAYAVMEALGMPVPEEKLAVAKAEDSYVINQPRLGASGFDLFVPVDEAEAIRHSLSKQAVNCSEATFEKTRVLATIPRFGVDLTEAHLPPEGGLEERAISYAKGCYIGQEVIARIRTYGQVRRVLRGLRLEGAASVGDEIFYGEKSVGKISSVVSNPDFALGLIAREANEIGTKLRVGEVEAAVVTLPFERFEEDTQ